MTPTMTELTRKVQNRVGRERTLLLLSRAGVAQRASKGEFTPIHILELMAHRLEQGWTAEKIAKITPGKLIQLTRKYKNGNLQSGD